MRFFEPRVVLLQAYGDELDEFVSTPQEILMKVVEDRFPLLAKGMDSSELQTLEYKVN
jgi:mannose-6-phosphate isomerase class I